LTMSEAAGTAWESMGDVLDANELSRLERVFQDTSAAKLTRLNKKAGEKAAAAAGGMPVQGGSKSSGASERRLSVLLPQRAQNIEVVLHRARNRSVEQLAGLIGSLDAGAFRDDDRAAAIVMYLASFGLTAAEADALRAFKGDRALLGPADRLALVLVEGGRVAERVGCLVAMLEFRALADIVRGHLDALARGVGEIAAARGKMVRTVRDGLDRQTTA
jgi:hypothetical protein